MLSDKELKKKYGNIFTKNAEKYYPINFFKKNGLTRKKCKKCGRYFWSIKNEEFCGDCEEKYSFINKRISKKQLTYVSAWKDFSNYFKKLGYAEIKRYPVNARWRKDLYFVQASIDDFIPFVVQGISEPPANPLIVPQFCLRFNDIENVGVTGKHFTGFVMVGQHRFEKPRNYSPSEYLDHLSSWFNKSIGINFENLKFHEDVWAGSGNFGPSIEIFSHGLELANQVYMQFKQTDKGYENLNLKVLDMGMGLERIPWFTQGTNTAYDAVFPYTISKLKKEFDFKENEVLNRYFLLAGSLNIDEARDVEKTWKKISKKISVDVNELKKAVEKIKAIYSIAEHSRSLIISIGDGTLPSNSGGGYNLRVIFRRAFDFIRKNKIDLDFLKIIEWQTKETAKLFPEIKDKTSDVKEILKNEIEKYIATRKKFKKIIKKYANKKLELKDLIILYDSHGISPEILKNNGVKIPETTNFYQKITSLHEKKQIIKKREEFDLRDIPETEILFYDKKPFENLEFTAKVLKVINKKYVILNKTLFYGKSGGQDSDKGILIKNGKEFKVVRVFKQGNHFIHEIEGEFNSEKNEEVIGKVDTQRRKQLTQHHTSVHIINGAAKKVLGKHVWQAGAEKTVEKARLDITHYKSLNRKEIIEIETLANKVIKEKIRINKFVLPRNEAEAKYGFTIYQGGAVPGKMIRIVEIPNWDVEACGGTHLDNTKDAEIIKIIGSSKISDSVVRIELIAGKRVKEFSNELVKKANKLCKLLGCKINNLPEKSKELFEKWKKKRKGKKAEFIKEEPEVIKSLKTIEEIQKVENKLFEVSQNWKVPLKQLTKTAEKFLKLF